MAKDKYYVVFVPHYGDIKEWAGRRLTARKNSKDEFSLKEAKEVARKLKKRGDKVIQIKKVR